MKRQQQQLITYLNELKRIECRNDISDDTKLAAAHAPLPPFPLFRF